MSKEDLENLPSNSKRLRVAPIRPENGTSIEKPERKPVTIKPRKQLVAQGIKRKKSLSETIARSFIGKESSNVGQYILYDVLIPAAKTTLHEMILSGIEMMLYGERQSRHSKDRDQGKPIVSYGSFYRGSDHNRSRVAEPSRRRGRFDLEDIYFRKGDEAAEVLEGLLDILDEYEEVTVANYYELAGVEGGSWTDNKWGWTNLAKAYCTHTRNGYMIVFPNPVQLD